MRVTCISKNRNNKGVIVNYTLKDETGHIFTATVNTIKEEMKLNRYEFTNLQIDSIGRLVDKVNKEEIKQSVNGNAIFLEFERAYQNLMSGTELSFGCIKYDGNKFENFGYGQKIVELVDSDKRLCEAYMTGVLNQFEKYILKKGGKIPCKLQIRSKDGVFEKVIYTFDINIEISLSDYIKEDLGNRGYYKKSENYMVRAYKLDNPNQLFRNIYIAPDMSTVSIKEGNQKSPEISNANTEIVKTVGTNNGKTISTLDYIGMFLGSFFKHKAKRQSRKFIIGKIFESIFGK